MRLHGASGEVMKRPHALFRSSSRKIHKSAIVSIDYWGSLCRTCKGGARVSELGEGCIGGNWRRGCEHGLCYSVRLGTDRLGEEPKSWK